MRGLATSPAQADPLQVSPRDQRARVGIQSFPDSFVWPVGTSPLQQYQQVGNAVFPLLASALGTPLAEAAGFNLDPERYGIEPKQGAAPPVRTMEEHLDRRHHLIRGASVEGRQATPQTLRRAGRGLVGSTLYDGHASLHDPARAANMNGWSRRTLSGSPSICCPKGSLRSSHVTRRSNAATVTSTVTFQGRDRTVLPET